MTMARIRGDDECFDPARSTVRARRAPPRASTRPPRLSGASARHRAHAAWSRALWRARECSRQCSPVALSVRLFSCWLPCACLAVLWARKTPATRRRRLCPTLRLLLRPLRPLLRRLHLPPPRPSLRPAWQHACPTWRCCLAGQPSLRCTPPQTEPTTALCVLRTASWTAATATSTTGAGRTLRRLCPLTCVLAAEAQQPRCLRHLAPRTSAGLPPRTRARRSSTQRWRTAATLQPGGASKASASTPASPGGHTRNGSSPAPCRRPPALATRCACV